MTKTHWFACQYYRGMCRTLYFWPLIVAGGRMVVRIMLNLWNMVEPGGADLDQTIST
ncbi:MAG: hypothetical protein HYS55_00105 [Candidatus Omnitrophica bacterium]|nr:hypothetical protein [Candidatus Omnitrophota bacterium]